MLLSHNFFAKEENKTKEIVLKEFPELKGLE